MWPAVERKDQMLPLIVTTSMRMTITIILVEEVAEVVEKVVIVLHGVHHLLEQQVPEEEVIIQEPHLIPMSHAEVVAVLTGKHHHQYPFTTSRQH
jgi:hypothetical protein